MMPYLASSAAYIQLEWKDYRRVELEPHLGNDKLGNCLHSSLCILLNRLNIKLSFPHIGRTIFASNLF